ncbi:BatD family protein [Dysgonomonas sp. 25]|uniref:BatD family protein n=1 Tax=Dysgonomonas sp. 25 TaxID=2302933 RepID=UPI0013CFB7BF|nr:BatD family protein [Dysgonomonas sp. 25]
MKHLQNTLKHTLLILALMAIVIGAKGQGVTLKVDAPDKVEVGEIFYVRYVAKTSENIDLKIEVPEDFGKLEVRYGPSIANSTSMITKEGKTTTEKAVTYSYSVVANKGGKYTLPIGKVTVGGKVYKSDKKTIEAEGGDDEQVMKSPAKTQKKDTPAKSEKVDAFVRTIVSKDKAATTDTLTLTYRLYTTAPSVNAVTDVNYPYLKGDFYSRNITPKQIDVKTETYKGKKYHVFDIYKLILQPRTEGTKKIAEGSIVVGFQIPTGEKVRDPFWGEYDAYKTENHTLKLEGVTIEVMNLVGI